VSFERISALLLASLLALCASFIVAIILDAMVPRITVHHPELAQTPPAGKLFTKEDLDRAEREAEERLKQWREEVKRNPPRQDVGELKQRALPVSWIPWLLLPFFYRLRELREVMVIVSIPLVLVLTPIVLPWELFSFSLACATGYCIARFLKREPEGAPNDVDRPNL
jgi:hypothetical protein